MADSNPRDTADGVVVIGLGRFGGQVAASLARVGHDVLGIDKDQQIVRAWSDRLTRVVEADCTDEDALRQTGVPDFGQAVVGIGTDVEASVLTVLALAELGIRQIWAKAITARHGKILSAVGADHVIYPEASVGEQVARLITGKSVEVVEFAGFAVVKTRAPADAEGRTLADSALRTRYGITVVAVRQPGQDFTDVRPDSVVQRGDLVVVGAGDEVRRFRDVIRQQPAVVWVAGRLRRRRSSAATGMAWSTRR